MGFISVTAKTHKPIRVQALPFFLLFFSFLFFSVCVCVCPWLLMWLSVTIYVVYFAYKDTFAGFDGQVRYVT